MAISMRYAKHMGKTNLLEFLTNSMLMTDVYQPVVVKELLLYGGQRTKGELAASLAAYDIAVQEYYERIVMRWPKITLTKHGIVDYERKTSTFRLLAYPKEPELRNEAVRVCEKKIEDWFVRVPRDDGHRFHGIAGSHSTRSRAVVPRDRGQV